MYSINKVLSFLFEIYKIKRFSPKFVLRQLIMEIREIDPRNCAALQDELIRQIERYFYGGDAREHFPNIELENSYRIATVLDPRFKKAGFLYEKNADIALLELVNLVQVELEKDAAAAVYSDALRIREDDFATENEEIFPDSSFEIATKRARFGEDRASYGIDFFCVANLTFLFYQELFHVFERCRF